MKKINRERFDAFVRFARSPQAVALLHELEWFESEKHQVLATLIIDLDQEFSGLIFAPDLDEKYRCVSWTSPSASSANALDNIKKAIESVEADFENIRVQGDESGKPTDFFKPVVKAKRLNPSFKSLLEDRSLSAAKSMIEVMMRWHDDQDGNFVDQFQSTGFDMRIWELYLLAVFVEAGYKVSSPNPAPDFLLEGADCTFTVEATTINPSVVDGKKYHEPVPESSTDILDYANNYLPIRFAGPLNFKLQKRYWDRHHVSGKPFVIAIQDFHAERSMTYSADALPKYLYGVTEEEPSNAAAGSELRPNSSENLKWGSKDFQSGFFYLPDSEHVSAVLANPAGTLSKFNRKGVQAGFGGEDVCLLHAGRRADHNKESGFSQFSEVVTQELEETWLDGMVVFHNPKALFPLPLTELNGAVHVHVGEDGSLKKMAPNGHLISSTMSVIAAER